MPASFMWFAHKACLFFPIRKIILLLSEVSSSTLAPGPYKIRSIISGDRTLFIAFGVSFMASYVSLSLRLAD